MKWIIAFSLILSSFQALADEEYEIYQTTPSRVKSFSVSNGYFELEKLVVNYYDSEKEKIIKVRALVYPSYDEEETASLLLAKTNGWKVSLVYDTDNVSYDSDCEGYESYTYEQKDDDGDSYKECYLLDPQEIVIQ